MLNHEFNYNRFGDVKYGAVIIDNNAVITHSYKHNIFNLQDNNLLFKISEPVSTIKHVYSENKMYEHGLVCVSSSMKDVIKKIDQVAKSNFTVILQGETGTGKSLIASVIHNISLRKNKPFVSVDMGVIPETLIESELFGYEKGSFTGATQRKTGFFEHANYGTLFIDELQNMSLNVQGKLLSVLDEKKDLFYWCKGA